jgi:hypothetical protein
MRKVFALLALLLALPVQARDAVPAMAAPGPELLIAQVDDSDLKEEEGLVELMEEEYDKDKWSMGSALGLSLVPGGGFGLMYAEKKAQAAVPFVLAAVGFGLGAAYMVGAFDEEAKTVCVHTRAGTVGLDECDIGNRAGDNQAIDPRSSDMNTPYFATKADYTKGIQGENFDGTDTGILILGATYIGTTLLGAIWSGLTVYDHNEQLRKDIESTAQAPTPTWRPVVGADRNGGLMGLAVDF